MGSSSSFSRRAGTCAASFLLVFASALSWAEDAGDNLGMLEVFSERQLDSRQNFQFLSGEVRGVFDLLFQDQFELIGDPFSCTLDNWSAAIGLTDGDTASPPDNRRYSGGCGLRIQSGDDRYLIDFTPTDETALWVRFYIFMELFTPPALLYEATDDGINKVEIWYNNPAPQDLTLRVFDTAENPVDLTFPGVTQDRWHSVEFAWVAGESAPIRFALNSDNFDLDLVQEVETSGLVINAQRFGLINGLSAGGTIDVDAFESRRVTRPGRLLVGDVNGDGIYNAQDLVSLTNELNELINALGQPDCDENGQVDSDDFDCVLGIIASQSNPNAGPGL